jgi:hypothetical protein
VKVSYSFTNNATKVADLTMGGSAYYVYMPYDGTNNVEIAVDLDRSGGLTDGAIPTWYTQYGAMLELKDAASPHAGFNLTAEAGDDIVGTASTGVDLITVTVTNGTADNIEIGTVGGACGLQNIGSTNNKEDYSVWGTHCYQTYAESGPDKLTFTYPDDQTEHLVYYSSGATTATTSESGSTYDSVVAIGVDAAVLDTEVTDFSAQNLIIVGGPCVNLAAADVMENPDPCTTGFEEGKAMLKLYERTNGNVALLVAGMTGMDTRRAARALGDYGSHTLTGTEMEVAGTSLTQYTVTAVTAEATE